jgi:hypothetical protein
MGSSMSNVKTNQIVVLIIIMLVLGGCYYAFTWKDAPYSMPDTFSFTEVAQDLADGSLDSIHIRTAGYPVLLLLTQSLNAGTRMLFYVQLTLYLFAILLISLILLEEHIHNTFILFFVLLSLLPPAIEYTAYTMSEILTLFFLANTIVCSYWAIRRQKLNWMLFAGINGALCGYVKPNYQLLPMAVSFLLLVLGISVFRAKIRFYFLSFLVVLFSSSLILSGFMFYNLSRFNYFGLTPFNGFTLSTRTVSVIEELPDEYAGIREILITHRNFDLIHGNAHTGVAYITTSYDDLMNYTHLNMIELSDLMFKLNILLIKKAPMAYLSEVGRALVMYMLPSSTSLANNSSSALQLLWTILHFTVLGLFIYSLILILGAIVMYLFVFNKTLKLWLHGFLTDRESLVFLFSLAVTVIALNACVSTFLGTGETRYHVVTDFLNLVIVLASSSILINVRSSVLKNSAPIAQLITDLS